jgi:dimeric dUTPase (all-alpha-NTP-PPase superfamily)
MKLKFILKYDKLTNQTIFKILERNIKRIHKCNFGILFESITRWTIILCDRIEINNEINVIFLGLFNRHYDYKISTVNGNLTKVIFDTFIDYAKSLNLHLIEIEDDIYEFR